MKTYKVLDSDLKSPFQNFQFELGKKYHCDNFNDDITKDCAEGFYATDIKGLLCSFNINRKIFLCEVSGKQVKQRSENIKLIRECSLGKIKRLSIKEEKKLNYKLSEALFPINPLLLPKIKKVTEKDIELLRQWDSIQTSVWDSIWDSIQTSVWDSIGDSVQASVGASIQTSVWDSIRASVGDSIQTSVWDSVWDNIRDTDRATVWETIQTTVWNTIGDFVWAYISSLFPNIKKWKYIEHKEGINPFQSGIDLWKKGLIPSYDGKIWRLHTGKNAKIIYELNK